MDAAGGVLAAVLGLVFGSFATALSWRLPRGIAMGADRSRCPACDHVLGPADLVPVLSWLLSRGRCRHCGAAVHWRYPVIELATMALFLGIWALGLPLAQTLVLGGVALGVVVMTVTDLEDFMIPDAVLLGLAPLALVWRWLTGWDGIDLAAGTLAGLGLGLALHYGSKALRGQAGLGLGDVKFLGVAGAFLGLVGLVPFLILSGLAGILLGGLWRLAGGGAAFPFGPALAASLMAGLMWPGLFLWITG